MREAEFSPRHSGGTGPVFEARAAAGISQSAMAELLNCTVRAVRKMETEGRAPVARKYRYRWKYLERWAHSRPERLHRLLEDFEQQRRNRLAIL